jgi:hypothetical protein
VGRVPALPEAVVGIEVVSTARSLGVVFGRQGVVGVNWAERMQKVRSRYHRISRLPGLSAFGRAFAANAYGLSTLLYGAQYTGPLPPAHEADLGKWSAALVDAGKSPGDDLRRPPGVPKACIAAHPREGGFGLLSVHHHLLSRWACEAVQLLVGESATPWVAVGRALVDRLLGQTPGGGWWSLVLCERHYLFPPADGPGVLLPSLPEPLRSMAIGLRALPPLQHVGDAPLALGGWCWHIPLWANPLAVVQESWEWFGQQRVVTVGLESVVPDLVGLPNLQTVGQAVRCLRLLESVCGTRVCEG